MKSIVEQAQTRWFLRNQMLDQAYSFIRVFAVGVCFVYIPAAYASSSFIQESDLRSKVSEQNNVKKKIDESDEPMASKAKSVPKATGNMSKRTSYQIPHDLREFLGRDAISIITNADYVIYSKAGGYIPFEKLFSNGELTIKASSLNVVKKPQRESLRKIIFDVNNYTFSPIADCIFETNDIIIFLKGSRKFFIFISNRCKQWFFASHKDIVNNNGKIAGINLSENLLYEWVSSINK